MSGAAPSVIIVAPPRVNDRYYKKKRGALMDFYKGLAQAAEGRDVVRAVASGRTAEELEKEGVSWQIHGELKDVWIRDVAPVQVGDSLYKFVYDSKPLRKERGLTADIDHAMRRWLASMGVEWSDLDIVCDGGGNFVVEPTTRRVVTTTRILEDNPSWKKPDLIRHLQRSMGVCDVAIIPQEPGDVLGHADGAVCWLAPDVLGVLDYTQVYTDGTLYRDLVSEVHHAFHGAVRVVPLPYDPSDDCWGDFASAEGDWANVLHTDAAVYVPSFGKEGDTEALEVIRTYSPKPVVPIDVRGVAIMGGAVNCLTWWVRGPPAARILATAALCEE